MNKKALFKERFFIGRGVIHIGFHKIRIQQL